MSLKNQIAAEIYKAMKTLGASPELLSIIGGIGDTLDDAEVLHLLKAYNEEGTMFSHVIFGPDDTP